MGRGPFGGQGFMSSKQVHLAPLVPDLSFVGVQKRLPGWCGKRATTTPCKVDERSLCEPGGDLRLHWNRHFVQIRNPGDKYLQALAHCHLGIKQVSHHRTPREPNRSNSNLRLTPAPTWLPASGSVRPRKACLGNLPKPWFARRLFTTV